MTRAIDTSTDAAIALYQSMVYGLALTRTRSPSDADDIFQEVFLAYHRRAPDFNEEEHRKAWLLNAVINCTKKHLSRKTRHEVPLPADLPVVELQAPEDTALYDALLRLPDKYRTVLHLYYFEQLSVDDISRRLKSRPGTVRMQMTRAREQLKEQLKGEYFDE